MGDLLEIMMHGGSRLLPLALCLWTCSVCTGEVAVAAASEAVLDSTRERTAVGAPDLATQQIVETVGPGENPGRRRRADARRRTHTPTKSPGEEQMEQRIQQEKALKKVKEARDEAIEEQKRQEAVHRAEQKLRYDQAKARIEATVQALQDKHRAAEADVNEAKETYGKAVTKESDNAKMQEEETEIVQKTRVMRDAIHEAQVNIDDALGFCKAVKQGDGTIAYQKSYLAAEHRKQSVGGPGGFARLSGEQLNIPWLVNLNTALGKAKLDTNVKTMTQVQKLIDIAGENVETLEKKWKAEELHRARVNEALTKDAGKREVKDKEAAKREIVDKKLAEIKAKESSRKAKMASLKAKTTRLKTQAAELEEKALKAAAVDPTPAPAPKGGKTPALPPNDEPALPPNDENKGTETRLGMSQGDAAHKLIVDAQRAKAEASKFKAMEHTSKQQLRAEKAKLRASTHAT